MVDEFTLFELHLDDAEFSNAVAGTPEAAEDLVGDVAAETTDDADEATAADERGRRPRLRMAAFAVVVAVGVRTILRRLLDDGADDDDVVDVGDEESVAVDLDESVEA